MITTLALFFACLWLPEGVTCAEFRDLCRDESHYDARAVSSANCIGICQVSPRYSRWTARQLRDPFMGSIAGAQAVREWWERAARAGRARCYMAGYKSGNAAFKNCLDKSAQRGP